MHEVINFLNNDDLKELDIKFISDNCEITRIKQKGKKKMENNKLIVHFKKDYGIERMYPTCET